jgi:hypothetical protein
MEVPTLTDHDAEAFDALDEALRDAGAGAALGLLVERLDGRGEYRALLDALLLKARHELGLPPVQAGPLGELSEPVRTQYEDRYVEAIRTVGRKLLDSGDIPGAWPYFRAIAEKEPVAEAIGAYAPGESDERLGAVVEVAFNEGVHPRKGFELILDHYGACSAISAFEHLPADEAVRVPCAARLVAHLHEQLVANLRADIARRGQPLPPEGTSIPDLLGGRDWLFSDDNYHIDVSHLGATVRVAPILTDPAAIGRALGLTEYGRRLSDRHRYEGEPPFEMLYEDHAVYLGALLGRDVDAAIAHFRAKIAPADPDRPPYSADTLPAQVLVRLLVRLDRLDEAIDVAAEHLADLPESALICPGVASLCRRAGRPDRLARIARDRGDLVHYLAATLELGRPPST